MMQRLLKEKTQRERVWKVVQKRGMKERMETCVKGVMKQESREPTRVQMQSHQLGWKERTDERIETHDDV